MTWQTLQHFSEDKNNITKLGLNLVNYQLYFLTMLAALTFISYWSWADCVNLATWVSLSTFEKISYHQCIENSGEIIFFSSLYSTWQRRDFHPYILHQLEVTLDMDGKFINVPFGFQCSQKSIIRSCISSEIMSNETLLRLNQVVIFSSFPL